MANSYTGVNFNIDTSTNVAGLTALKGSAPAAGDKVYVYNGATVTVDSDIALLQFILGQTSSGAAGAGNRYGLLTFNSGVTVTFDGNATNTNSGILSNPTSADASSKGCLIRATNTTFTNSVGANNTANRWTITISYGTMQWIGGTCLYSYLQPIAAIPGDAARTDNLPIIRGVNFGTVLSGDKIYIGVACNIYCDFRFNTNNSANAVSYLARPTTAVASGGVIDYAGFAQVQSGGWSGGPVNLTILTNAQTYYIAADRITFSDTRQTQIVPADLAFTDTGKGGQVSFTISNAASYAVTDEIYIYNATGDTLMGGVCLSKYNADGFGLVSGLTDGTAYTLYAKATSDGLSFSAASANASAVTPTHSGYDFPTTNHVTENDTVDGVAGTIPLNKVAESAGGTLVEKDLTFAEEAARNAFDGTAANISTGKTLKLLNVDTAGTNDKIYTAAEEAARNSMNGTVAADILTGKSVKVLNVTTNGSLVQKDLTFAEEVNRNTADSTKYKADEHFLLHNVDTVGSYAGGSLTAPAAPVGVEAIALSSTSMRIMWDFVALVETYDVYQLISAVWTKVSADVAGESADITGLTASTPYSFRVVAKNDAGSSDPSATVTASTKATTAVLERIHTAMVQLISGEGPDGSPVSGYGMRIADGYNFDWISADTNDAAIVDAGLNEAWANVDLDNGENCLDTIDTTDPCSMSNEAKYKVDIWFSLNSVVDNPEKAYKYKCGKAIEDIKKIFNTNYGLLPDTGVEQIMYNGAEYMENLSGNALTVLKLTTRWTVRYVQDRKEPNITY